LKAILPNSRHQVTKQDIMKLMEIQESARKEMLPRFRMGFQFHVQVALATQNTRWRLLLKNVDPARA
jgi:hypothetical protein